ncbi:succinate dehydrogenase cytochrome b560 subunit, mitochondrial-like [Daphnia pulicaria]|uniref:succinate dehydrogenase cytochrome b560 subunit, mitochondrial-like n=1 Tax=Daphnia pulicaria TaxID=35523 RepID=UPI001EEC371A|nr:succinate dehydrogenase cytochrome b560 subunit, mitochondrial-like [Daphnia pulicaria]
MALLRTILKNTTQTRLLTAAPVKSWQHTVSASTFGIKSVEANRAKPLSNENFENKNKRLQRPISPHLSIYQFNSNMAASITHRFTGLAQNGLMYGLAIGAMVLPASFPHYLGMLEAAHLPLVVLAGKFLIAFPFSYHLINGMRHLVWDTGFNLTIKGINSTGYVVLAAAVSLALYLTSL